MKDINSQNILEGFERLSKREQQLLLNDMADPKKGGIAQVFGQGGGIQIQFESSVKWYEKMGLLKEVV